MNAPIKPWECKRKEGIRDRESRERKQPELDPREREKGRFKVKKVRKARGFERGEIGKFQQERGYLRNTRYDTLISSAMSQFDNTITTSRFWHRRSTSGVSLVEEAVVAVETGVTPFSGMYQCILT